jgi:hypothetical protein
LSRPGTAGCAPTKLIARLAHASRDDPRIGLLLGITAAQVRGLRKEFGIPAGAFTGTDPAG